MKHDSSSISSPTSDSLAGHLLVATPQMTDPRFKRAVIFICQHDTKAAMGLVINKPNTDLSFKKLAEHLNLTSLALILRNLSIQAGPLNHKGDIFYTPMIKCCLKQSPLQTVFVCLYLWIWSQKLAADFDHPLPMLC